MKQAIVIRKDLKIGPGKAIAQGSHASLSAYKKASFFAKRKWDSTGQKKIVLKIDSEKDLIAIAKHAQKNKVPVALIADAGHTQVSPGTKTAVGIGPAEDNEVDKIVKHLKLY